MVPYDACLSKAGAILPERRKEKESQLYLTCTHRLYISRQPTHFHHPPHSIKTAKYAFFSSTHGFIKRVHLGHETNLKNLK